MRCMHIFCYEIMVPVLGRRTWVLCHGPQTSNTLLYIWQVLMVDSTAMAGLKERYDNCDDLLGSSHVLLLSVFNPPHKPLTLTVNNPSGGGKKSKSGSSKVAGVTSLPQAGVTSTSVASRQTQAVGYCQGKVAYLYLLVLVKLVKRKL